MESREGKRRLSGLVGALVAVILLVPASGAGAEDTPSPVVYSGAGSESMVQVTTPAGLCSGAVVQGGRAVVTAAHCVVVAGEVLRRVRVEVQGRSYTPYAVGVRVDYTQPGGWCAVLQKDHCTSTNGDYAVLWFKSALPAKGLRLPSCQASPGCEPRRTPSGSVMVLGFQMTGGNGVRAWTVGSPRDGLRAPLSVIADPENAGVMSPMRMKLYSCTIPESFRTRYSNNSIGVRCGMIQGASGGVMVSGDGTEILGVVSGVYDRNLWNLIVPAAHVRGSVWGEYRFFKYYAVD